MNEPILLQGRKDTGPVYLLTAITLPSQVPPLWFIWWSCKSGYMIAYTYIFQQQRAPRIQFKPNRQFNHVQG